MVNKTDDTLMYFVGDIAPYMEDAGSIFQHVAHILSQGDITFCQLEANLSHRGIRLPQVRATLRYDPKMAAARQWKCDAAILHLNCGCEGTAQHQMQIKQVLQKMGLPVLSFEGNMADERQFDEVQTKRLIDLFVTETLGLKKVA